LNLVKLLHLDDTQLFLSAYQLLGFAAVRIYVAQLVAKSPF